jgi:hypothetical protein
MKRIEKLQKASRAKIREINAQLNLGNLDLVLKLRVESRQLDNAIAAEHRQVADERLANAVKVFIGGVDKFDEWRLL